MAEEEKKKKKGEEEEIGVAIKNKANVNKEMPKEFLNKMCVVRATISARHPQPPPPPSLPRTSKAYLVNRFAPIGQNNFDQ